MPVKVPGAFLSESRQWRRRAQADKQLTATDRILAVVELLEAAELISRAGVCRGAQLRYHQRVEQEWRDRMREFLSRHVDSRSSAAS